MSGLREALMLAIGPNEIGHPWPETERRADAALATFRQWMDAEGLVVVPRELDGKSPKHWGPVQEAVSEGEDWGVRFADKPEREVMAMYRKLVAMIAAAPDSLGDGP